MEAAFSDPSLKHACNYLSLIEKFKVSLLEETKTSLDPEMNFIIEAEKFYNFESLLYDVLEACRKKRDLFSRRLFDNIKEYQNVSSDREAFPTCFVLNRYTWMNHTLLLFEFRDTLKDLEKFTHVL